MKRFFFCVLLVTLVGIGVVYGEVEAVKTGYRIRQLNLKKLSMITDRKQLEFEVAKLKAPRRLEKWMQTQEVCLSHGKFLKLARRNTEKTDHSASEKPGIGLIRLARIFLGTAQAGSEK